MTTSDSAKEADATSARTARYGRFEGVASTLVRLRVRRISQAVIRIRGAHTR